MTDLDAKYEEAQRIIADWQLQGVRQRDGDDILHAIGFRALLKIEEAAQDLDKSERVLLAAPKMTKHIAIAHAKAHERLRAALVARVDQEKT